MGCICSYDHRRIAPMKKNGMMHKNILSSFEFPSRQTLDELWAKEVEERIDAYENEKINAIPAKDVFAKIEREQGEE